MSLLDQSWLFSALLLAILFALVEIGHRIGLRLSVDTDELRHEQLVGARDAIGILLSLLLGFTLAMAIARFDQRKQLIIEEANDIGSAILRCQMLPEPGRGQMQKLLR